MASVKFFFTALAESFLDFKNNFARYAGVYIAFLIMNVLAAIPWEGLGVEENSVYEILINIAVGLISLVIVTNIILIEKSLIKQREKEKLIYAAPTYLIYTLYSSLIILASFVFLMFFPKSEQGMALDAVFFAKVIVVAIPALVAGVCVAMVPTASVLIDNDNANYFKISFKMAKKAPLLIFLVAASALFIELPSVAIEWFASDWIVKLIINLVYAFIDSVVIIVVTKTSVSVFYHLKKLILGEKVY